MPFGLWAWVGSRNYVVDGIQIPIGIGNFEGEREAHVKTFCRELCKNG